eukprot:scaffold66931_cov29-Prasinocladus_malaysianus.AAC.1
MASMPAEARAFVAQAFANKKPMSQLTNTIGNEVMKVDIHGDDGIQSALVQSSQQMLFPTAASVPEFEPELPGFVTGS